MKRLYFIVILFPAVALFFTACSPDRNRIKVQFDRPSQLVVYAHDGRRIFFDWLGEIPVTPPPGENDILLVSYLQSGHYNPEFADNFPGRKIIHEEAELNLGGIHVVSFPSVRKYYDSPDDVNAVNYAFLIEVDGFRIFYGGVMGNRYLTGKMKNNTSAGIDIACMQIYNRDSAMNLANLTGFKLIEEVRPGVVFVSQNSSE